MRKMVYSVVLVFGCFLVAGAGSSEAQQRVLPTGTPTIIPKKSAVTPTPRALSATEVEARNLGVELARIDSETWSIVRSSWRDETQCLEAVDAHLDASVGELKRLIRTSSVMECAADPNSGRQRLRLTSDEARRAFLEGYRGAADALRSLREDLTNETGGVEVLEAARSRQADWQDLACRELASERVPRSKGKPVKAPVKSTTKKGSS